MLVGSREGMLVSCRVFLSAYGGDLRCEVSELDEALGGREGDAASGSAKWNCWGSAMVSMKVLSCCGVCV